MSDTFSMADIERMRKEIAAMPTAPHIPESIDIHPGDLLRPDPRWNETSGNPNRRLPGRCEVLRVEHTEHCSSGMMLTVLDVGGQEVTLDSGWFVNVKRVLP